MKSKAWYFRYKGDVYASGPLRFEEPVSEQAARAQIRGAEVGKRLPAGTEFWPAGEKE